MKLFWITLCYVALPVAVLAQERISGHVHNTQTGEFLPYATVVVKGKNIGTISDRDGLFELRLDESVSPADSVLFSHVGFRGAGRTVGELAGGGQKIFLERGEYKIDEIVVTDRKSRLAKLGHSSGRTRMFSVPFFLSQEVAKGDRVGKELGTAIKIKHDSGILSLGVLININKYDMAKFRVSFYALDGGEPGELLVHEDITFELEDRFRNWYELDLTPYSIFFSAGQEVLVTLTLLDEEGGEGPNVFYLNGAMMSGKGIYKKNVGDRKWTRFGGTVTMYLNSRIYL